MPIVLMYAFCNLLQSPYDEVSKYMIEIFILLMENPMAQTICFWQGCFRLKFTYIYASQTQLEEAILLGGYQ